MSHFTVMVINTGGNDDIEKQLAPYQENNMGTCPEEYLEFIDREEEFLDEYNNGSVKKVLMSDGSTLYPWDNKFKDQDKEDLDIREFAFKELYPTLENFVSDHHGYKERDEKTGRYGYYENPNCKWDWYQVGGRWAGMLRLKEGYQPIAPLSFSWTWDKESAKKREVENRADVALKSHIDWDDMMAEGAQSAGKRWDKVAKIMGTTDDGKITQPALNWNQMIEKHDSVYSKAREEYYAQPIVKEFTEKVNRNRDLGIFATLEDFNYTREDYVKQGANNAISTFAVLIDGKWIAKGEMGWFGCSSESDKEAIDWSLEFYDHFIKPIPDDSFIAVVDCHI